MSKFDPPLAPFSPAPLPEFLTMLHRALIDGVQGGIVIIDRDYRILVANRFAQDWLKRTAEEMRGQLCYKLFHDSDEVCPDCAAATTFQTGQAARTTHTGLDSDGGLTYAQVSTYPLKGDDGEVTYVIEHVADISDRVHLEQESAALMAALRESEEKYRTLVELSNDLVWTLDSSGNFVWVNRRAEEVSAYRLEDWVGKSFAPIIPPEDLPLVQQMVAKTLAGQPCSYEARVRRKDGSLFVLLVNSAPIISNGQVTGVVNFGKDITDRKRAEEQLLRRNRELEVLNAVAMAASQSLDLDNILERSLDSVLRGMGFESRGGIFLVDESGEQLRLKAHRGLPPEFIEQERQVRVGECLCGRAARTGRPLFSRDSRRDPRHTRLGSAASHAHLVVPLKAHRKTIGVMFLYPQPGHQVRPGDLRLLTALGAEIGVAIDNAYLYERERAAIAELRASEERYRDLFDNATDIIYVIDLAGNIVSANGAAAAATGFSREELLQLNLTDLLDQESRQKLEAIRSHLRANQPAPQPFPIGVIKKDGARAILAVTTRPVVQKGRVVGAQGIARDVTEHERLHEQLRSYHQGVIRAREDERRSLARDLHDDTAQRLVAITRLLDGFPDPGPGDRTKRLEEIRHLIDSALEGIRRFAKELRPSIVDDLGLLPALEGLAAETNRRSPVRTLLQVRGQRRRLPAEMELMLFRICQEALSNAVRHAEARTVMVAVEMSPKQVRLTITDDGKGFDPEEPERRFVAEGKLGLLGMRERAELINGTLEIHSSPGQGTRVVVEVAD